MSAAPYAERPAEPGALVVGAGPTGLALACVLQQMGIEIRIVDRQVDRVHESRALAIQPRTLELLRPLDLSAPLVERGNPAVGLRIHSGERVLPVRLFDVGVDDTAFPFLLFLSQAEVERILAEHLERRGVRVERATELVALEATADGVTATLRRADGTRERATARYLVGCDGAHSFVRHRAGIPFDGGYPQTFVLADLAVDGALEAEQVHAYVGAGGMLFFFPLRRPAPWRLQAMWPFDDEVSLDRLQAVVSREVV